MMYNRLVGGVQLRQLRVRNDSCVVPAASQRTVLLGDTEIQQAFFFTNDTGSGACFERYSWDARDTRVFGPCTEFGRAKLGKSMPNIDKYNTSCEGSGFSYTRSTDSPSIGGKLAMYDSSGFVRNVVPSEPGAYLLEQVCCAGRKGGWCGKALEMVWVGGGEGEGEGCDTSWASGWMGWCGQALAVAERG